MVPVHRFLHRPFYPECHVTISLWAYHGHPNICQRSATNLPLLALLIFEQDQHMVYSEFLIAGDLSKDEVDRVAKQLEAF